MLLVGYSIARWFGRQTFWRAHSARDITCLSAAAPDRQARSTRRKWQILLDGRAAGAFFQWGEQLQRRKTSAQPPSFVGCRDVSVAEQLGNGNIPATYE